MAELRNLPKVDVLANTSSLAGYTEAVRTDAARAAVAWAREEIAAGREVESGRIEAEALRVAAARVRPSLDRAINLSGVILHTGLGRARLGPSVAEHLLRVAEGHASLEFDLGSGQRGDRQTHVEALLTELTGSEAALVVNNAAAAVFLSLNALAAGKEVVLSRGQMVEIGGSFRMPDIVRRSGCRLVEVGCTNKTRLSDYDEAVGADTAAFLRCHPSNFAIVGFTDEPSLADLVELAHRRGQLLIDDMGSGCLVDTRNYGLPKQATLQEAVASGADIVTASGDKLLGGPQAGLVVGSKACVGAMKRHPLARALRVDKLTLAALEATLRLYATGRHEEEIPTLSYLARPLEPLLKVARRLARAYSGEAVVEAGITEVGGGSAPGTGVPTWRVGLVCHDADALLSALRAADPPVVARIENGRVWLDPRTLDDSEVRDVERAIAKAGK